MTISNMAIAELSVLGSFLCFLALIIKKVWPLLVSRLDEHIEKVKNQIDSAEKLRENSANALSQANQVSLNIQDEVEDVIPVLVSRNVDYTTLSASLTTRIRRKPEDISAVNASLVHSREASRYQMSILRL